MEVTGIVVNEKISVPKSYKKAVRQELFYCKKFGIESHIKERCLSDSCEGYRKKLLGRVNYILLITFVSFLFFRERGTTGVHSRIPRYIIAISDFYTYNILRGKNCPISEDTVMKLTGNLKKQVEKAESKQEKKSLIENAGLRL